MFQGFCDDTFNFFLALTFNNNTTFFHQNHDWYLRAVREPLLALAADLGESASRLDPRFDLRPARCVSRINRDLRFARDKSPYRDHMWISFHRPGPASAPHLGAYVELRAQGVSCGIGLYERNDPMMKGFRELILAHPRKVVRAVNALDPRLTLHGNVIRRLQIPQAVPQAARAWYPLRGFYLEREIDDFSLIKSAALTEQIADTWRTCEALYRCLLSAYPAEA